MKNRYLLNNIHELNQQFSMFSSSYQDKYTQFE